jgi:hypothetical protein
VPARATPASAARVALAVLAVAVAAPAGLRADAPPAAASATLDGSALGSISGTATDAVRGGPAADIPLGLFRPSTSLGRRFPEPWVADDVDADSTPLLRLRSGEDGRFEFAGLDNGSYVVRPLIRTLAAQEARALVDEEAPHAQLTLALRLGAVLSGQVVDESGQPLLDHFVFVAGIDDGQGGNAAAGGANEPFARSGPDGRFRLVHVPAGRVFVQGALMSYGWSRPLELRIADDERRDGLLIVVPDERAHFEVPRDGIGGVGISLDFDARGPLLRRVLDGMPAKAAGLLPGDRVVRIDGRPTIFMSSTEFVSRCKGPVGTAAILGIEREAVEPFEVTIVRAPLHGGPR